MAVLVAALVLAGCGWVLPLLQAARDLRRPVSTYGLGNGTVGVAGRD